MTAETFLNGRIVLHCGDSRDVLKTLPDNSIDSFVTDPPYALVSIVKRFGGKNAAAVKVPEGGSGAYARASAGFMGKSWDTGETAFAVEFWAECLRVLKPGGHVVAFSGTRTYHRMVCAIEDAGFEIRDQLAWAYGSGFPKSHDISKDIDKRAGHWRGRAGGIKIAEQVAKGTEYVRVAKGTPITPDAVIWDGWGTALKPAWEPICLARKPIVGTVASNVLAHGTSAINVSGCAFGEDERWPANIVHDGSEDVLNAFPYSDGESAARYFYTAKADADDRLGSKHPTVKPVDLMQWLCRLVTPPGGTVLDPFSGTGTTGEAAFREGFNAVLIEREPEYQADIRRRMALCTAGPQERKRESIKAKGGDTAFEPGSLFAMIDAAEAAE